MTIRITFACIGCLSLGMLHVGALLPAQEAEKPAEKREGSAESSEREAVRQKIAEAQRKIAELRAANKLDQAAELERDLRVMVVKIHGDTIRDSKNNLIQHIERLRKEGRIDEAAKVEQHLRDTLEQEKKTHASAEDREHDAKGQDSPENLERRSHHLQQAAENLTAAGFPEQAEQLQRQADKMREALRTRFAERSDHRQPELEELHAQIRQQSLSILAQNERIERLEQIVHKLQTENLERQNAAARKGENKQ